MDELPTSYWRRWYVYAAVPVVFGVMTATLGIADSGVPAGDSISGAVFFASLAVLFPAMIWSLVGYYYDAKALGDAGANWTPLWYLWAGAHLLLTPLLVVPVYLVFRTIQTGTPWTHGHSIR